MMISWPPPIGGRALIREDQLWSAKSLKGAIMPDGTKYEQRVIWLLLRRLIRLLMKGWKSLGQ